MAREFELKILLDEDGEARLRAAPALRELRAGRPATRKLVSVYYDTPGRTLRAAGIALRLRRSGRRWVQTVKRGRGRMAAGLSTPEESEAPAPGGRPDLELVEPRALREAVAAAIGGEALAPVFETRFRRTSQLLAVSGGEVELAIDSGEIVAGERSATLREAELELKSGKPEAVSAAGQALFTGGPVRFAARSKAERGYALAAGEAAVLPLAPRRARKLAVEGDMPAGEAASAILSECLDQIAANMALIAGSDDPGGPHQLRVGLRRLRSALSALRRRVRRARALAAAARDLAAAVGALRDIDVLRGELLAPLGGGEDIAALDRALARRVGPAREILRATLKGPDATRFLFETGTAAVAAKPGKRTAREAFARALDKRWSAVTELGDRMEGLDMEARHVLRKRLKKLRYPAEFARGMYAADAASFLEALRWLQNAFGALNDLATAEDMLTGPGAPGLGSPLAQRGAGRVLGWYGMKARRDWEKAVANWQRLVEAGPFWR